MSANSPSILVTKITGNLPAAVGVIVVCGSGAVNAVLACWKSVSGKTYLKLNQVCYGQWIGPKDRLHQNSEDVVLCRVDFDNVEIHCHGGPAVLNRILDDLALDPSVKIDVRRRVAGQDRIVADAWHDLQAARTINAVHLLLTQANGAFSRAIEGLITDENASAEQKRSRCDDFVRSGRIGVQISQPPEVVILGPPNAGKSTLINRLLGWERAIVDATPGTTRDVLREEISLAGWPLTILDTAGLRQSSDDIEKEGIAKALKLADHVACILLVIDGTIGWTDKHQEIYEQFGEKVILIMSKSDLISSQGMADNDNYPANAIAISALTGDGIESLIERLIKRLGYDASLLDEAVPFRQSHIEAIQAACQLVDDHAAFAKSLSRLLERD